MREFVHFRRFAEADSVAMALERAHTEAASILTYNDENSLACADFLSWRAVLCSGDYSIFSWLQFYKLEFENHKIMSDYCSP